MPLNKIYITELEAKITAHGGTIIDQDKMKYMLNGWNIKASARGIYWHTKIEGEFSEKIAGRYTDKGGKPFTPEKILTKKKIDSVVSMLGTKYTQRFINRQLKEIKDEERRLSSLMLKTSYCYSHCSVCPEGDKSETCSKMQEPVTTDIAHCVESKFWESAWCNNATLKFVTIDIMDGAKFNCKITNKPCPYTTTLAMSNRPMLKKDRNGEHFTTCSDYINPRPEEEEEKEEQPEREVKSTLKKNSIKKKKGKNVKRKNNNRKKKV